METTLPEWLQAQLDERNITAAELARRSGISAPQITRLLSGQRGVSELSLRAIAEALSIPPETMFRKAGLLPPVPERTEQTDRLLYLFHQLDPDKKEDLLGYAEFLTLSRLLGHNDLTVLRRYLAQTDSDLREAHARAPPADNW